MTAPAPYVPGWMIPDGEVLLGDPEPGPVEVGDLGPPPRGFDSWVQYAEAGSPYHPINLRPGEEQQPGVPERIYREQGVVCP